VEERNISTGIRMDLIHQLVELHHGTIEVHNNTDGPGCEFKITLPLGSQHLSKKELSKEKEDDLHLLELFEEKQQHPDTAATLREKKKLQRQRIILIESEEDVSDFLVNELKDTYDVTLCNTGKKGIAAIGTTNPDLVISDVKLYDMEGQAICSRIKSNSSLNYIPVILLTNNDPNIDRLELLEAAADAYIMRPFNMDILRRTIVNLLHRQKMLKLKFGRTDQLEEMVGDISMKSPNEKLMERIMAFINDNLDDTDISNEDLADNVGISRVHLHRKMKELTGQTPHDFIRSIRLKKASQLLKRGDISITEVVYACGFGSAASFSTIFKKQFGVSPREYMMKTREE
jgi:AraC-like DNA-binding protein